MKVYQKLVRDRIPEIIESTGKKCTTRVLQQEEYLEKLDEKLQEELTEYRQSGETEELADLMEVLEALLKAKGISWEELKAIQEEKCRARGAFEERILLISVE